MTVRIEKETRGRFGNKIFHYNTMMQLSSLLGKKPSSCKWAGMKYFASIVDYIPLVGSAYEITCKELNNMSIEEIKKLGASYDNIIVHEYALHGPFYKISQFDPRDIFKLKPEYVCNFNSDQLIAGIHIRGGDIRGLDGNQMKEVHSFEYYKKAIDYVIKKYKCLKFFIATDDPDPNYATYQLTMQYLINNNLLFNVGTSHNSKNFIGDFSALCSADIIIGGSSTFVLAAGIIGKRKKVIHSYGFFEQFLTDKGDWYSSWGNQNFYKDAINNKLEYYDIDFL